MARSSTRLLPPFLKRVALMRERVPDQKAHPFDLPLFRDGEFELSFERPVTIFVGENGVGKSTLIEAIAGQCGFAMQSGTRNFASDEPPPPLGQCLRLAWLPKVTTGFFLRAESLFNLASQIDRLDTEPASGPPIIASYGGRSLHRQSHGEAFLALFENRFTQRGIYLLDEPEAALSPSRQLRFLKVLRRMERSGQAQIVLATHAPMIMAYPGADLLVVARDRIVRGRPEDTSHWRILSELFADPADFYAHNLDRQGELFEMPPLSDPPR
jgi:predicted ATPase